MAPARAPQKSMVIALLPVWGALVGAVGAQLLERGTPVWVVLLAWIVCTRLEQRVLRLSNWYLLASALAAGVWWAAAPVAMGPAVTAHAAGRAAMISLAWISRPAASGSPLPVTTWGACAAIGVGGLVIFAARPIRPAVAVLAVACLVVRLVREWSYRRNGGVGQVDLAVAKGVTEVSIVVLLRLL